MAQQVELNRFKNYMLMVNRSVGSDLFRNLYASVDGEETDILRDGILSCAYFVSSVLFHCKLIDDLHTTVRGLEANLQRSGWTKIEEPKVGSVIVWEPTEFPDGGIRRHAGFYIGDAEAISNRTDQRVPKVHSMNFETEGKYRAIETIYWHENFDEADS